MKRILLLLLYCWSLFEVSAQVGPLKLQNQTKASKLPIVLGPQRGEMLKSRVDKLEADIQSGESRILRRFLGNQVYVDIAGEKSGYYSSNQAESLLESFFAQRKLRSFSFSSFNSRSPAPYATGRLAYVYNGAKESAQIYVMWKQVDSVWVISKFNIY